MAPTNKDKNRDGLSVGNLDLSPSYLLTQGETKFSTMRYDHFLRSKVTSTGNSSNGC